MLGFEAEHDEDVVVRKRVIKHFSIAAALLLTSITIVSPVLAADVRIGVLAVRGNDNAVKRWYPLAEYLERRLSGHSFNIAPLGLKEMEQAVRRQHVDFVLTNTGNYIQLEIDLGVNCIATLRNLSRNRPTTQFGSVIFTRRDRPEIRTLRDIKGRRLMGVSRHAFGGFQMAWREMKRAGIDPFNDTTLQFSGLPQDQIVYAVRDKRVDVGIVRTDTLERMHAEGAINIDDFSILNARHGRTPLPFKLSTRLYPEWPFAKAPHVAARLAKEVAVALLTMEENEPSARAGRYAGWTVPLDYSDVHQMFRELGVGPYAKDKDSSILRLWHSLLRSDNLMFYAVVAGLFFLFAFLIWGPLNRQPARKRKATQVRVPPKDNRRS